MPSQGNATRLLTVMSHSRYKGIRCALVREEWLRKCQQEALDGVCNDMGRCACSSSTPMSLQDSSVIDLRIAPITQGQPTSGNHLLESLCARLAYALQSKGM